VKAYEYILTRQTHWALNRGIRLVGSKGIRGRPVYASSLKQNLFEPLISDIGQCFSEGDGGEMKVNDDGVSKMQALHSSSALAVNVFQYWQKIGQVPIIAAACGFCRKGSRIPERIVFEEKVPIGQGFRYPPNIDVVIHNCSSAAIKLFAIESKFTEAYTARATHGLKSAYLKHKSLWNDIPHTHELARSICPDDRTYHHLHPAQLIKHILGLKCTENVGKDGFRLLYLWYDAFGEEGAKHKEEIDLFTAVVRSDGIRFHSVTYQELITNLSSEFRSNHPRYIEYMTGRYL